MTHSPLEKKMPSALNRFRKALMTSFLMLLALAVPVKAWADCSSCYWNGYRNGYGTACSECAQVFRQLVDLINTSTNSVNTNIDVTRQTLSDKIDTATNAIVSAIEKQSASNMQLKQSEINYDAATQSQKAGAEAQDMFTEPSADLMDPNTAANACATMATATAATTAANNATITAKALSSADARKTLYTSNSSGVMQQKMAEYKTNFCSDKARERGMCDVPVAAHMQDADINAGSLMAPSGGGTYSADEAIAARSLIDNIVGPIPQESLPIALEKTPAGQRFVLEQRAMSSVRSMANFSLNSIFAANNPEDTSSSAAAASKLSVVGLMKKFVEDRFGDPKYRDSIATMNEVGLLRQLAENLAFQNWLEYYSYLQGERTEGLLATNLALNARERSERTLAALRSQASNLNAR
jgi:hypothetical protein